MDPQRKLIVLCTQSLGHQALGFENLDPFFRVSQQGPCFTAIEEAGDHNRFVELELACSKADGVATPDPV